MKRLLFRRGAAGLAAGAMAIAGLATLASPAQADSNYGYVIGTIKDNAGRALPGAEVEILFCQTSGQDGILDSNGCDATQYIDNEWTDRNGRYVASVYKNALLRYPSAAKPGHFIAIASQTRYTTSAGVAIAPVVGTNAAGPAFALVPDAAVVPPPAGSYNFTGVVTTSAGAPASGGWAEAYDAATNEYIDGDTIFPDGRYFLSVPPGKAVKLDFGRTGSTNVWFGGNQARSTGTTLIAPAPAAPATANAVLSPGGTITGTVRLPAAGSTWRAWVTVFDVNGAEISGTDTDATGNFSVDLDPGVYYLRGSGSRFSEKPSPQPDCPACVDTFDNRDFVGGYYYKGKKKSKKGVATSLFTATPITVSANGTVSVGVLNLTNALANLEKPTVKSKKGLRKGAKLKVDPGVWNDQARAVFTVTWKVGKTTVGTGLSLKLTKKIWKKVSKKPKKFTVTVVASDKYGDYVDGAAKVKVVKALAKKKG